jgi:hypothetical protein
MFWFLIWPFLPKNKGPIRWFAADAGPPLSPPPGTKSTWVGGRSGLLWNRPKRLSSGRKRQTMALIEDYGFIMLPGIVFIVLLQIVV